MRYLFLLFVVFSMAACSKPVDNNIVETHYKYKNTTNYRIDVNAYRKAVSLIQFNYSIAPNDSLELDFRNISAAAQPFGAPEVDSAEVVFDNGRKIIYTLEGPNGLSKPRNIFNRKDGAYTENRTAQGGYNYLYIFTSTDYYNAK